MADSHSDPTRHPSSDPLFDPKHHRELWYLSHPLAGDNRYTFEQNMDHVVKVMRICFEEGLDVVAPYHTICLALDDDNPEWRRRGLECDCTLARTLGRVLLTGHKLSAGMRHERDAALECIDGPVFIYNFVGYNDEELRQVIRKTGIARHQ